MLQPVQRGWSCRAEHGERGWALGMSQLDGGDIQHPLLRPLPPQRLHRALCTPRGRGQGWQGQAARGRGGKGRLLLLLQPSFIKSQKTAAIKCKVQHTRLSPH